MMRKNVYKIGFDIMVVVALTAIALLVCTYIYPEISQDKHDVILGMLSDMGTNKKNMIDTIGNTIRAFGQLIML